MSKNIRMEWEFCYWGVVAVSGEGVVRCGAWR
jgi:hypothetical protein